MAAALKNLPIVKYFVENGAAIFTDNTDGISALVIACVYIYMI